MIRQTITITWVLEHNLAQLIMKLLITYHDHSQCCKIFSTIILILDNKLTAQNFLNSFLLRFCHSSDTGFKHGTVTLKIYLLFKIANNFLVQ